MKVYLLYKSILAVYVQKCESSLISQLAKFSGVTRKLYRR